ncbi:hypothetical protein MNBD_NITROSPINAE04-553 [hydrothermal vent metagenome]|uniref:Uncharacterized protein n=1 Tax=hydrothermal vent metagenome TaxID=652676 RepID=A0A3B1C2I9_9ZZZZ
MLELKYFYVIENIQYIVSTKKSDPIYGFFVLYSM